MLNEAMDAVVLVKGWKKGSAWSFPRGKINKDEKDLDCAVREVDEETGYNLERADLVKDEKDMKYFEMLIREQNLRLYVFRGVPEETYFEPKTRKEISKIEWFKLSDLPTLRKTKQQGETVESLVISANKFYNVAPFLGPLKKWISQEKKRDAAKVQNAIKQAEMLGFEEPVTYSSATNGNIHRARPTLSSQVPSDLPEVSVSQPQVEDPSLHLKRLLNVHSGAEAPEAVSAPDRAASDEGKANALLDLLRGKAKPTINSRQPNTPLEQTTFLQDVPRTPHHHHPRPLQFSEMPPPPSFPISPYVSEDEGGRNLARPQTLHTYSASATLPQVVQEPVQSNIQSHQPQLFQIPGSTAAPHTGAPYHRTGDPQFARSELPGPSIPPASNLPALNNHKRALLSVFKGQSPAPLVEHPSELPLSQRPSSFDRMSNIPRDSGKSTTPSTVIGRPSGLEAQNAPISQTASQHQANLLDLFRGPNKSQFGGRVTPINGPAELAAQTTPSPRVVKPDSTDILALLTKDRSANDQNATPKRPENTSRKGETFATVSGPLNMPHFEKIQKLASKSRPPNGTVRRVPKEKIPKEKTSTAPQPGSVKILSRPQTATTPSQSPKAPADPVSDISPLSPPRRLDEPPRPFQPQILKRPQSAQRKSPSPSPLSLPTDSAQELPGISPPDSAGPKPTVSSSSVAQGKVPTAQMPTPLVSPMPFDRRSSQPDTHKQTLLSLFSGAKPTLEPPNLMALPSGAVSMAVSPLLEQQPAPASLALRTNSISPPSVTRSRIGSLSSMVSGQGQQGRSQTPTSARTTTPGDKAFLMGYLEKFAKGQA
ncbi:MAG: hypothetical protein Q9227_008415 [Pyrenula ochraceoflavens]